MAAKTSIKLDAGFAAGVARVQPALAAWRAGCKRGQRIPESLWQGIVTLAQSYGVSPVAQALQLNYAVLKGRVAASRSGPAVGAAGAGARFVELPVLAGSAGQGSAWVIELEDRRGAKLSVRLAQSDPGAALALAQGLWRRRA